MHLTNAILPTLFVTISSVAASSPIIPPQNPSSNGQYSSCSSDDECLTDINNVRASQEGLDPITLPSDWDSLSGPEQLFTFMNLERTSRGLNALAYLSNTFGSVIQTAITDSADPDPGSALSSSWNSIWAGGDGMIPLSAMYGWMYYDGPGGFNEDCTGSDMSGCWGHRDNILASGVNVVDAGQGSSSGGTTGFAALLWNEDGTPADVVLSWTGASAAPSNAPSSVPSSEPSNAPVALPSVVAAAAPSTAPSAPPPAAPVVVSSVVAAPAPSTLVTVVSTTVVTYVEASGAPSY